MRKYKVIMVSEITINISFPFCVEVTMHSGAEVLAIGIGPGRQTPLPYENRW